MYRFQKLIFSFCLLSLGFAGPLLAQCARVTFYAEDGQAFRVRANGKYLSEGAATNLRVRISPGNQYNFDVFTSGNEQPVVSKKMRISPNLISASYVLKQNKKGEFVLKTRDIKMDQSAMAASGGSEQKKSKVTYSYEKTETYAGPDGVRSSTEKGSGSFGDGGFKSKSTKSNTTMDDKGFNMSSETKERGANAAETLGALNTLGKLAKKNKKKGKAGKDGDEGGCDLVVEEVNVADASAGLPVAKASAPAAAETSLPAEKARDKKVTEAAKAPTEAAAAPMPASRPENVEGISAVTSESGLALFVMAEPTQPYEVVFEVETGMGANMGDPETGGFKRVLGGLVSEVENKKKKKKYANARIDGIVTIMGYEGKAIRFTGATDTWGKVKDYDGTEIYFAAKPARPYKVVRDYNNNGAMLGKSNIWARTQRTIRKIRKENPDLKFDAVLSDDGILYEFISFE